MATWMVTCVECRFCGTLGPLKGYPGRDYNLCLNHETDSCHRASTEQRLCCYFEPKEKPVAKKKVMCAECRFASPPGPLKGYPGRDYNYCVNNAVASDFKASTLERPCRYFEPKDKWPEPPTITTNIGDKTMFRRTKRLWHLYLTLGIVWWNVRVIGYCWPAMRWFGLRLGRVLMPHLIVVYGKMAVVAEAIHSRMSWLDYDGSPCNVVVIWIVLLSIAILAGIWLYFMSRWLFGKNKGDTK